MKVPLSWLRDYVDIKVSPRELAERLTMAGLEVKNIQVVGSFWENVVIGRVVALSPHPNADQLKLATVDLGTDQLTVVCGAPNIGVGQKVPLARVGAQVIDAHTGKPVLLKAVKIRGIISEGMICSERELGISDNHEGIMILPPEAPVGVPLGAYLSDAILDIDVTPNRPDCLSILGVAREVAALTGQLLRLPQIDYQETAEEINSFVSVTIAEPDLCPRYCAALITGIKVAPSPKWLQQRLTNCGMRPINNVVDVTNYTMLEFGQPLHAFDYDKLKGKEIIVRKSREGETIVTLDGIERRLNPQILVIADAEKAVAIAGIMGGLDSEVTEETNTILLESANFSWVAIRHACTLLQFQTEASIRFDKGLNSQLPLLPLKRAISLLLTLANGKAAKGIIDIYPKKSEPKPILFETREVKRLSGLEVSAEKAVEILKSLGFECRKGNSNSQVSVFVPYWRSDIKCSADLVEEVIRIIGYDEVPVTRLSSTLPEQESRLSLAVQKRNLKKKLQHILVGCGFQEILTYSLVSLEKLRRLSPTLELGIAPLKLANPMTKEQEYLRTTLRVGVLSALAHNQKFEQNGIRLFEIGKIFLPQGEGLPEERDMLCAVLSGARTGLSWQGSKETLDFFDAKGVVESMLSCLGLKASFQAGDDAGLFLGRQAQIIIGNDNIGVLGDVHPKVTQAFELSGTVCLIEIDVEKLLTKVVAIQKEYKPIPKFPSVYRDIAIVVDEEVSYSKVEDIIQSFPLVTRATLFDLYRGEQIPKGKKSFAIRVVYQSPTHTLTEGEVNQTQQEILARLYQELGAILRA